MTAQPAPPPPHALFMERRHGCQKQRTCWSLSLVSYFSQHHASVSPLAPHPGIWLHSLLPGISSPSHPNPLPDTYQLLIILSTLGLAALTCHQLCHLEPLGAAPVLTAGQLGEQAEACGRRLLRTGSLPLRVISMIEPGKGREQWLLGHGAVTSGSEYTCSSVLGWGTRMLSSGGTMMISRQGWGEGLPGAGFLRMMWLLLLSSALLTACPPAPYPLAQSFASYLGAPEGPHFSQ